MPAVATIQAGSGWGSSSLAEGGFGDVVVSPPVRGAFGVGELVHVVAAGLRREGDRRLVQGARVVHEVAPAAVELDQAALLGARRARHDGDEGHPDQLREVRLGHGGRAAGGLDHRAARTDPAVAQSVEEERAGEPVLEAAGRVRRLVLEIEVHAPPLGQREAQQVSVGRPVGVGLDPAHGFFQPVAVAGVAAVGVEGGALQGVPGLWVLLGVLTTGLLTPSAPTASRAADTPIIEPCEPPPTCINVPLGDSKEALGPTSAPPSGTRHAAGGAFARVLRTPPEGGRAHW